MRVLILSTLLLLSGCACVPPENLLFNSALAAGAIALGQDPGWAVADSAAMTAIDCDRNRK